MPTNRRRCLMLPPSASAESHTGSTTPAANPVTDVKTLIKATDDEWKVINPRLQAVVTARQAVMIAARTKISVSNSGKLLKKTCDV